MALLFVDGFDHYDPQQLDGHNLPYLARGKASYLATGATRVAGRRPSSFALRLSAGPGGVGGYSKAFGSGRTSFVAGVAVRPEQWNVSGFGPVLLGVVDANSEVFHFLRAGMDGRLELWRRQYGSDARIAGSAVQIHPRGWSHVEFRLTQGTSNGTLDARVNGVLAISLAGRDTVLGGGQLAAAFLGAHDGTEPATQLDFDDFWLCDTAGTINNSFLGDCRVDLLNADGAGTNNAFAVVGAPSGWQAVSDSDEASFIRSSALGQRSTFSFSNLPTMSTPTVFGAQVVGLARKTDAGSSAFTGVCVSAGVTGTQAGSPLLEELSLRMAVIERNPNGNAVWTEAALNAAEFGVQSA